MLDACDTLLKEYKVVCLDIKELDCYADSNLD